jgi:hypothetical protein
VISLRSNGFIPVIDMKNLELFIKFTNLERLYYSNIQLKIKIYEI